MKADLEKTKEGSKNEILELFDRIKKDLEEQRREHDRLSEILEKENEKRIREAELIKQRMEREKQELRDYINEDNQVG